MPNTDENNKQKQKTENNNGHSVSDSAVGGVMTTNQNQNNVNMVPQIVNGQQSSDVHHGYYVPPVFNLHAHDGIIDPIVCYHQGRPYVVPPYPGTYPGSQSFQPPTQQQQQHQEQRTSPSQCIQNSDLHTSMIVDLINKLDNRLQSIEESDSKLNLIQNELAQVRSDMTTIKTDNKLIYSRVNEMESFYQSVSNITDDFNQHKVNCSASISQVKYENSSLQNTLYQLQSENKQVNKNRS